MGRKRKDRFKDANASVKASDYYGTIFDSMCRSGAYQRLSVGARQFYTICRVQARSKAGRACLYAHGNEFGNTYNPDTYFVFPAKHQEAYGYDRRNGNHYLQELEKAGFIKKIESNNHIKKVNVYKFIDEWKNSS